MAIADIRQDFDRPRARHPRQPRGHGRAARRRRTAQGFAAAADEVEAKFGPVSLVFNNAGINLFQPIEDSSYDDWDWVLGVNLGGVINGVMTFAPRMKARAQSGEVTGGHITNTASMASFIGSGTPGIYNTSKFAVRGLELFAAPFDVPVRHRRLVRAPGPGQELHLRQRRRPAGRAEGRDEAGRHGHGRAPRRACTSSAWSPT